MPESFPLVFLDLDGVLNSGIYLCVDQKAAERHKRRELVIDPAAMARLNKFLERHDDAGVVISSDWRKRHDYDILAIILRRKGFLHGHKIVGQTPNLGERPRGLEILSWMKTRNLNCPYVILDDRDDMIGSSRRHLVQTDPIWGLTSSDVKKASDILTTRV